MVVTVTGENFGRAACLVSRITFDKLDSTGVRHAGPQRIRRERFTGGVLREALAPTDLHEAESVGC